MSPRNGQEDLLMSIIREVLEGVTQVPTTEIAEQVRERIEALVEDGEPRASGILEACAREGIRRRVAQFVKKQKGLVRLGVTERIVPFPLFVQMRVKREGRRMTHQLSLWWDLEWDEFDYVADRLLVQSKQLAEEALACHEIRRLRKQFPKAGTVGEACKLAGIEDPRRFRVENEKAG